MTVEDVHLDFCLAANGQITGRHGEPTGWGYRSIPDTGVNDLLLQLQEAA